MKFLIPIDLSKNELQNAVVQNLSVAPGAPKAGQIYFNTGDKLLYVYLGDKWQPVGAPVESIDWSIIKNTPTTFGSDGYGITDIALNPSAKSITIGKNTLSNLVSDASYVHTDNNFTTLLKDKLDGIASGAEVNTIKTISVNKSNVTPDAQKNVNITIPKKVSDLTNDKNFIDASGAPVQSVNGATGDVVLGASDVDAVPITRKVNTHPLSGDITLDAGDVGALATTGGTMTGAINMGGKKITNMADASAEGDAVNKKQLDAAIAGIGTVFNLKGSKATKGDLPPSGNKIGDVWFVIDESAGYIWIEKDGVPQWEEFGPSIDLSGYLTKDGLLGTTGQETKNAMTQKAVTDALGEKANKTYVDTELKKKADKTTVKAIPVMKLKTGTIGASATTVTVAYTGQLVNTFVKDATGEEIIVDVDINASNVVFTTTTTPASTLTCTVAYF